MFNWLKQQIALTLLIVFVICILIIIVVGLAMDQSRSADKAFEIGKQMNEAGIPVTQNPYSDSPSYLKVNWWEGWIESELKKQ